MVDILFLMGYKAGLGGYEEINLDAAEKLEHLIDAIGLEEVDVEQVR